MWILRSAVYLTSAANDVDLRKLGEDVQYQVLYVGRNLVVSDLKGVRVTGLAIKLKRSEL